MRKYLLLLISLFAISAPTVMAVSTGGLRISPQWPIMVSNPATFTIWAQSAPSYDVNVLLVTTQECYNDMDDAAMYTVVIEYEAGSSSVGIPKAAFTEVSGMGGVVVPPSGTTPGAAYTVASLKDHLDYGLSEELDADDIIYWAIVPLVHTDFDPLTTTPKQINVELDCDNPRMLVYLLGKSIDDAALFDMKVPPTNPGFLVPEITAGSIMAAATMFGALGLYSYRKKHQQ